MELGFTAMEVQMGCKNERIIPEWNSLDKFIQTAAAPRTKKEPTSDVLVNCNDSIVCLRYHNTLCILKLDVRRTI
jgi:hypothetical protein